MTLKEHHCLVSHLCGSTVDMGTDDLGLEKGLRLIVGDTIHTRKRARPTFAAVRGHLSDPSNAMIMLYWRPAHGSHTGYHGPVEGHYTLVKGASDGMYECINDRVDETISVIPSDELKERAAFMRNHVIDYPIAWFLRLR